MLDLFDNRLILGTSTTTKEGNTMLTINGMKFAKNDNEFINSLFESGGTCDGYYKRMVRGIRLFDMQNKLRVFVVDNKHNEQFFVTATMQDNKSIRYMNSTSTQDDKWLGLDNLGYTATIDLAKATIKQTAKA